MSRAQGRHLLLGIDLGTSSVKAVVTDLAGALLGQAKADYTVTNPQAGWAETNPADWLAATVVAVRQALLLSGGEICGIGLSGQMHGLVATDAEGHPVRPAILWSDSRAVRQVASYQDLPDQVRARLANPLSPGMAGPLLAWVATHEVDVYKNTRWALQPKDWIRTQLTGRFATEPSDASATLLYDFTTDAWDSEVIEALALDANMFPPILPHAGYHSGDLTVQGAHLFGLRPGIPVAAGAADTAAAALGSGLVDVGSAQLTIGTGAQIVTPVAALPPGINSANPVTHLYRSATQHGWYGMGAVLNAGLALGWVRQVLGASWQELYATASLNPSADDPFFLPHLNGERTPYLDPDMRGAWTGLSPRHDRSRLLRAALEGVAFTIRDAVSCLLPAEVPVDHLRLAGGGSIHPAWRQLLADVLGYTLRAVDVPAASGRGAALLGSRAAGITDEPALLAMLAQVTELAAEPRDGFDSYYGERYQAFTHQVQTLRTNAAQRRLPPVDPRRQGAPSRSSHPPGSLTALAGKADSSTPQEGS
jgi:xylulokinase